MSDPSDRTFLSDFRRFFLRGLVVLLPSVLTLWIVVAAYQFVDGRIAEPINSGVRVAVNNTAKYWSPLREAFDPSEAISNAEIAERAIARGPITREEVRRDLRGRLGEDPSDDALNAAIAARAVERGRVNPLTVRTELRQRAIDEWWAARWYMNLIGLVIAIVGVYTAGRLLGGFFGRRIYRWLETLITTLPVFKQVYPYVKQIVDFLFSDEKQSRFSRVVVAEYPRKGIWSIGFLTGPPLSAVAERGGEYVTVFIPSSPTPFTGYTITVPRADVIELPITVEEAIRYAVSAGVLVPNHQQLIEGAGAGKPAPAAAPPKPATAPEPGASPSRSERGGLPLGGGQPATSAGGGAE